VCGVIGGSGSVEGDHITQGAGGGSIRSMNERGGTMARQDDSTTAQPRYQYLLSAAAAATRGSLRDGAKNVIGAPSRGTYDWETKNGEQTRKVEGEHSDQSGPI